MSTAGLVLGMTGLAICVRGIFVFYPFYLILLAPLFVVVGLPLSGAAFYRARTDGTSLIIPLAGLATNAVAAALSTPLGFVFGGYAAFVLSEGGGGDWAP